MFEFDKPQGTVYVSPEASLAITDKKLRSFLQDLRGCWKNNFLKEKHSFQLRRDFAAFFLFLSNITKSRKRFLTVHKVCLTINLKLIIFFLLDLKIDGKNFFKKLAVLMVTKVFGYPFIVLSSVTNLREQFGIVYKVFGRLLWKL